MRTAYGTPTYACTYVLRSPSDRALPPPRTLTRRPWYRRERDRCGRRATGVAFQELPFDDGEPPPANIVEQWIAIYTNAFQENQTAGAKHTVAVHCIAGLGRCVRRAPVTHQARANANASFRTSARSWAARGGGGDTLNGSAPVMVAVALVEAGMQPLDAVEYVRKRRRGAINAKQIQYVDSYRPRSKKGSCAVQ